MSAAVDCQQECDLQVYCLTADYPVGSGITLDQKRTGRAHKDFNLILSDAVITDLSFSQKYPAAIEAKQVALWEAQWALPLVENVRQEQQGKIVQAEAAKRLPEALSRNPGYIKCRKIWATQALSKRIAMSQINMLLLSI